VRESAREREGGSERMRERGSISLTTHTTTSGSHTSSALEEVEEVEEEVGWRRWRRRTVYCLSI